MTDSERAESGNGPTERRGAAERPGLLSLRLRWSVLAIPWLAVGVFALILPFLGADPGAPYVIFGLSAVAGAVGLRQLSAPARSGEERSGAITCVVVGVVGLLLFGWFVVSMVHVIPSRQDYAEWGLEKIYEATEQWAAENEGQLPERLSILVTEGTLRPRSLHNPRVPALGEGKSPPIGMPPKEHARWVEEHGEPPPFGVMPEELAAWVEEHADYVLIRSHQRLDEYGPNTPLLYEKIQPGIAESIVICFGNGEVKIVDWPEARRILREAGVQVPDQLPDDN